MSKGTKQVRAGKLLALAAEWERTAEKMDAKSNIDIGVGWAWRCAARELREAIVGYDATYKKKEPGE